MNAHADTPVVTQGRIIAIDILRGIAILWVVLFHLWEDVKIFPAGPSDYYIAFWERLTAGEFGSLGTTFVDALMRVGYQGVPLFMMLSGLSLYLSASRKPSGFRLGEFFGARLRRALVPYYFGLGVMILSAITLAFLQSQWRDTSFSYEYEYGIDIAIFIPVYIDWRLALDSAMIFPRLLHDDKLYIPNGSLWFVVLILQYYMLFPVLRRILDRVGPGWFVGGALALTICAKLILIASVGSIAAPPALRLNSVFVCFRIWEFALGMGIAWLMVHKPHVLREWASAPLDVAGIVALGIFFHIVGSSLDWRTHYLAAFSSPMFTLGVTLLAIPLLARNPGPIERTPPLRLLAWTGVVSYAVLITNEPMRLIGSTLRVEGVSENWWWFFLIVVYIPVTLLAAWPVARILGLMPRSERAPRPQPIPETLAAGGVTAGS